MSLKQESSEKVTLNVLTKFIRSYSGDRETLPAFLTNCDNAISLAAPEQQGILCKYIISQLEGKAQLACSLKTFTTWSELKSFLKTTFGERKHSSHLLVDLQSCKQQTSESVTQFALRVEACLTRIQADIHYSCSNPNELIGRIAAMEDLALNTFILGLNSNISNIVRCRNPSSLNDAVTHAVEEEKLFNLTRISQRTGKFCSHCNKQGHTSNECFKKKPNSNTSSNPPSQKSYHVPNPSSSSSSANGEGQQNSNYNSKFCAYCKNKGHVINECRKRQYNNQHRSRNSQPEDSTQGQSSSNSNAPNNDARVHCCECNCINESKDDQKNDLNEE